jgi:hypothetical protein
MAGDCLYRRCMKTRRRNEKTNVELFSFSSLSDSSVFCRHAQAPVVPLSSRPHLSPHPPHTPPPPPPPTRPAPLFTHARPPSIVTPPHLVSTTTYATTPSGAAWPGGGSRPLPPSRPPHPALPECAQRPWAPSEGARPCSEGVAASCAPCEQRRRRWRRRRPGAGAGGMASGRLSRRSRGGRRGMEPCRARPCAGWRCSVGGRRRAWCGPGARGGRRSGVGRAAPRA